MACNTADQACDEARQLLSDHLRRNFPYLKDAALQDILEIAIDNVSEGLQKQVEVMKATKSRISFFSLSAELRNQIYHYALDTDQEIDLIHAHRNKKVAARYTLPALLATCKQVRAEASPIYWANKKILFFPSSRNDYRELFLNKSQISSFERLGSFHASLVKKVVALVYDPDKYSPEDTFDVEEVMEQLGLERYGFKPDAVEIDLV